jgi:metallo-beta-lactamase class B
MPRLLVLALPALLGSAPLQDDPLTRPIEAGFAARWLTPQLPLRVYGDSYLVGFGGLNIALIQTSAGLILIDAGPPQGVAAVEANIRALGFALRDVKLILSTEPHWDHAGGLAALARDTGATVIAGASAAKALRSGTADPADPQHADLARFPGVPRLRAIRDGKSIRLGDTQVVAHATPGHTAGSMSWSWHSCASDGCKTLVFAASINPVASDGYRFSAPDNRTVVTAYRATFARLRTLPCDILLTGHPDASGGDARAAAALAGVTPDPFVDPQACRAYADKYEARLEARLRGESAR